jgi:hypothetical protein
MTHSTTSRLCARVDMYNIKNDTINTSKKCLSRVRIDYVLALLYKKMKRLYIDSLRSRTYLS